MSLNILKGKKILSEVSNFILFCEHGDDNATTNPTRMIQFDYKEKRWYEYFEVGPVSNPTEIFINWVD